jgi:MoxR-like ATPase
MADHNWRLFNGVSGVADWAIAAASQPDDRPRQISLTPDPIQPLLEVPPPNWRRFSQNLEDLGVTPDADRQYWEQLLQLAATKTKDIQRGVSFRVKSDRPQGDAPTEAEANGPTSPEAPQPAHNDVLDAVNAALYLRRPLLVTGRPGSGKTSLAYAIAYALKLGPVLMWPITARSTLQEGLYQYDAIARLQDAQLNQTLVPRHGRHGRHGQRSRNIGQYIRLGPVGTAFLPSKRPRVLLLDEVDKSDINLPNELLNLFEEGRFEIPELVRLSKQGDRQQSVQSADGLDVIIREGSVRCGAFPFIIMTSNGERDFPPAFYRRCLRVEMPPPDKDDLTAIVKAHLQAENVAAFEQLIQEFADRSDTQAGGLATDQLLNTVYLMNRNADEEMLKRLLFTPLSNTGLGT